MTTDFAFGHLYRVKFCLMKIQLLHSQLFGNDAIRITTPSHAFHFGLHAHILDVGL